LCDIFAKLNKLIISTQRPGKNTIDVSQPPPHRCRTFPLLLIRMGYVLLCGLWV